MKSGPRIEWLPGNTAIRWSKSPDFRKGTRASKSLWRVCRHRLFPGRTSTMRPGRYLRRSDGKSSRALRRPIQVRRRIRAGRRANGARGSRRSRHRRSPPDRGRERKTGSFTHLCGTELRPALCYSLSIDLANRLLVSDWLRIRGLDARARRRVATVGPDFQPLSVMQPGLPVSFWQARSLYGATLRPPPGD